MAPSAWLAQQSQSADPITVVVAVAALIIAVVIAGLAVMHIRGRLLRKHDDRSSTESWLDELRAMHRRGEVSDEEFQAASASLLARVTGSPVPAPPPAPSTGPARGLPRHLGDPSTRTARPGFDLTGAPLPTPGGPITERPPDHGPPPGESPSTPSTGPSQ
jgi:hypothetical protein